MVPPNDPPKALPAALMKFLMERPSIEVLIPLVEKSGAAVAPALCDEPMGVGSAKSATVRRMAAKALGERGLMDLNT